jgi:transposase-like protein
MSDFRMKCQRCHADMELRDPAPGGPWKPDQYWVCNTCGRHFWTTYPAPPGQPAKPAAGPAKSDQPAKPTPEPTPAG